MTVAEDATPWIVGRGDWACYVEQSDPLSIGGQPAGEVPFATEIEALEYAIMCDQDLADQLIRNLRDLKRRLRNAKAREKRALSRSAKA